jgi:alkanesulfonate monooxygenase SsuD/methylene tetrahydromethanopterin reductase-like flavin-dependent oxidoreductase (luciferase family)
LPGVPRELHLLAFGNTRSAGPWRHPDIDNSPAGVRRRLIARAQAAEAGGFDAVFFADGLNFGPPATWAYKTTEDFEPLTTTAALSSVTEAIGLVVTGSATLVPPYQLARQLLSLDHLSGGRAGWNLVTPLGFPRTYCWTGTGATRGPWRRTTRGSIGRGFSATG